ncbi:hypothetical protein [Algoriphagus namhaensis]
MGKEAIAVVSIVANEELELCASKKKELTKVLLPEVFIKSWVAPNFILECHAIGLNPRFFSSAPVDLFV